jgi:hypothetical protein
LDGEALRDDYGHPGLSASIEKYEFAVAVLEGRPVFENDIVYRKEDGYKVLVEGLMHNTNDRWLIKLDFDNRLALWKPNQFSQFFTWTPPTPKRTFTLNGVELPCPVTFLKESDERHMIQIHNNSFYYKSGDEYDQVTSALIRILTEARDKP